MPAKAQSAPFDLAAALANAYRTNDRINQYLIRNLPAPVWRMTPPGGKGRTVAGIAAHMHNVRIMWLKAAGGRLPAKLEGNDFTPEEAIHALEQSCEAMEELVSASMRSDGRVKGFKPDVAGFFGYLFAHDAHHRGQISLLARLLGHPLPQSAMFGMWEWGTR
jgi:uncharacterized damage-inducible protein DinB